MMAAFSGLRFRSVRRLCWRLQPDSADKRNDCYCEGRTFVSERRNLVDSVEKLGLAVIVQS